ncbi:MAG: iron-containing alcohol dehydrogenase family protein [Firmicutes bacterium]|nr:iron-containing alcohol dehydrogenase family protein [Bacillota bacterium]
MKKGVMREYMQTAPVLYLNEEGLIKKSGQIVAELGKRALISGGPRALQSIENDLVSSLDKAGIAWEKHVFKGECSENNINLIMSKANNISAEVIIGVGGGKSLDCAKVVADRCGLPIVTIPTIAATCAAVTPLSIVYNDAGEYQLDYYLRSNPDLVLVDPIVITNAPVKYFTSGILDALSKWYEGRAAVKNIDNPDIFTASAIKLAELLYTRINKQGEEAIKLVKYKKTGQALKDVIDLNIFTTGIIQSIGQKTCRGAAAHSIHNALTIIEESHELLHGLKVGYGIVVQLFMEDLPEEEIKEVVYFFRKLGLEPSLKGLKLPYSKKIIEGVAQKATTDPVMRLMPFKVSKEMVISAIDKLENTVPNY